MARLKAFFVLVSAIYITTIALVTAKPATAGFVDFKIRGTPTINDSGSTTEFIIDEAGEKAALGSNDINGRKIGSITELHIDRLDNEDRFSSGSGPNVAPYFNL